MSKQINNPQQLNLFTSEMNKSSVDKIKLHTSEDFIEKAITVPIKQDALVVSIASVSRYEIYAEILKRKMD